MDKFQEELKTLQDLEAAGTLDDAQKSRLSDLRVFEATDKTAKSALAQKEHFREKAEKEEAARKALEEKLKGTPAGKALDVEDYIGISSALDGLDNREKEYLALQHKLTGKPLHEIRQDEDFSLWQTAHRAKVEKERALKPSATQATTPQPTSLEDKLNSASLAEKEKLLIEAGLYQPPRGKRADSVDIGRR